MRARVPPSLAQRLAGGRVEVLADRVGGRQGAGLHLDPRNADRTLCKESTGRQLEAEAGAKVSTHRVWRGYGCHSGMRGREGGMGTSLQGTGGEGIPQAGQGTLKQIDTREGSHVWCGSQVRKLSPTRECGNEPLSSAVRGLGSTP